MIEINLIPDVKHELIQAQRIRFKVITASIFVGIFSVGVVVLLSFYVYGAQSLMSNQADDKIADLNTVLVETKDLSKMLTIQNQLTKISDLHADKKIDSRFFDLLSVIIPPAPNNVNISNLAIDSDDSTITIDGQADNSYAAVEVFIKTIEGATLKFTDDSGEKQEVKIASNIIASNTSYSENTSGNRVLRFTISFEYIEELFSPSSKQVSIAIMNEGNVTDSFLGIPKSIFIDNVEVLTGETE